MTATRDYGLPFTRFLSSVPRHQAEPDAITGDSRDWLIDPNGGRLVRRLGSTIVDDTLPGSTGLVEAKWAAVPRQLLPVSSAGLLDGYPTHGLLLTAEAGLWGEFFFRGTNVNAVVSTGINDTIDYTDGAGPTTRVATIAASTGEAGPALAQAVQTALRAAGTAKKLCGHGFNVLTGVNDRLDVSDTTINAAVQTAVLRQGYYHTYADFAIEVTRALNAIAAWGGTNPFAVAWTSALKCIVTNRFAADTWTLWTNAQTVDANHPSAATTGYGLLGFDCSVDTALSTTTTRTAANPRTPDTFWMQAYDGNSLGLLWATGTNVAKNAANLLGYALADQTGASDERATTPRTVDGTSASGSNEVIAAGFNNAYPISRTLTGATAALTPFNLKATPLWSANSVVPVHRCGTERARRVLAAGSRRGVGTSDWLRFPNLDAVPVKWNRGFTDRLGNATIERIRPCGHIPPLAPPVLAGVVSTGGPDPWSAKDRFFVSVIFKHADGSYSMPFLCKSQGTILPSSNGAGGLVTLGAGPWTATYPYLTWIEIPIGPSDVVARLILRSLKVDASLAQMPNADVRQMGIVAVINNNTQTTYNDIYGTDSALNFSSIAIRTDHKWPDRARYYHHWDQRFVAGYLKPNPAAIVLAPRYPTAGGVVYTAVPDTTIVATEEAVAIRDNQTVNPRVAREFVTREGTTYASAPVALGSTVTLQDVVDRCGASNGATTTTLRGGWGAQLAPGADGSATTDNLVLTQVFLKCDTVTGSATVTANAAQADGAAGSFANVAAGMLVKGAGIPAGSYVKAVTATTLTIGDQFGAAVLATATASPNVQIGWDFGDTTPGEARAYSNALPAILYFTKSYLDAFGTSKRALIFTGGSPGDPVNAADNYYVGNRREAPEGAGILMGFGNVLPALLVLYSQKVAVLRNIKGGKSGLDDDYRLEVMTESRGCIAWDSVVQGNGWVGYLTPEGYAVNDGLREIIISTDVFNLTTELGEWGYEINACVAAAAGDTDNARFSAKVIDGRLHVCYRSSAATTIPDRRMVYDFSSNAERYGLDEVLSNGRAFGWSAPCSNAYTTMGSVRKSDGAHSYGAIEGVVSGNIVIVAGVNDEVKWSDHTGVTTYTDTLLPGTYVPIALAQAMQAFMRSHTVDGIAVRTAHHVGWGTYIKTGFNDVLMFSDGSGGPYTATIPQGDYDGPQLAAAVQAAMNLASPTRTYTWTYDVPTAMFTGSVNAGTWAFTTTVTGQTNFAAEVLGFNVNTAPTPDTLAASKTSHYARYPHRFWAGASNALSTLYSSTASSPATVFRTLSFANADSALPWKDMAATAEVGSVLAGDGAIGGSIGDGRIDEFDTLPYDVGLAVTVSGCVTNVTPATSKVVTSLTPNAFAQIPVGAALVAATQIASGATVQSKTDNQTIVMSLPALAAGTNLNLTFYGKLIQPIGYCATDLVGSVRPKQAKKAYVVGRKSGTGLSLGLASDKNRSYAYAMAVPSAGASAFIRAPIELPQGARGNKETIEFSLSDDGTGADPPEVWGIEAMIEPSGSEK